MKFWQEWNLDSRILQFYNSVKVVKMTFQVCYFNQLKFFLCDMVPKHDMQIVQFSNIFRYKCENIYPKYRLFFIWIKILWKQNLMKKARICLYCWLKVPTHQLFIQRIHTYLFTFYGILSTIMFSKFSI